jgi:hypothetical protein
MTIGATIFVKRKPATSVVVLRWACEKTNAYAFALWAPAMAAGYVGRGPRFVYQNEAFGFQIEPIIEPLLPLLKDI